MKVGDGNRVCEHLVNLMHYSCHYEGKGKMDVIFFIFQELNAAVMERRVLYYAPYIFVLIYDQSHGMESNWNVEGGGKHQAWTNSTVLEVRI